jgi:hypothetical protein
MITKRGAVPHVGGRPQNPPVPVIVSAERSQEDHTFEVKRKPEPKRMSPWPFIVLILLAILGLGGFYLSRGALPFMARPVQEETRVVQVVTQLVTLSPNSASSLNETPAPTQLPSVQPSQTATVTLEPTATSTPQPTVPPTATVLYPDGQHFTLFYNESSLHLLNRSRTLRSVAAFSFERIDQQGEPMTKYRFEGARWEVMTETILPKYCISIKIFKANAIYIDPPDCKGGYLSVIQPTQDDRTIFWTEDITGNEFRVLWLGEEVARCKAGDQVCEVYIP